MMMLDWYVGIEYSTMQLRLAINRMRLLRSKSSERSNQAKKEIAGMLEAGKERLARIRVQAVIFDDYLVEAYNMVELYCETAATRMDLLNTTRLCPPDLKMTVCSLIFAAPKLGCEELLKARELFLSKYGVSFPCECVDNRCINPKVMRIVHSNDRVLPSIAGIMIRLLQRIDCMDGCWFGLVWFGLVWLLLWPIVTVDLTIK